MRRQVTFPSREDERRVSNGLPTLTRGHRGHCQAPPSRNGQLDSHYVDGQLNECPPPRTVRHWYYLLDQKPDNGVHEIVLFWFLVSDSEQQ